METYKKIDDNTLEVTYSHVSQREKKSLIEEKQMLQDDIKQREKEIAKIDEQLNILDKIGLPQITGQQVIDSIANELEQIPDYDWMNEGM